MTTASSSTSFFTFGTNDSFISKAFQGLKYRNLPPALRDLLASSTIAELHWATLGPVADSWLISFKDSKGTNTLRWGPSIPSRLQTILTRTWHSPRIRAFLGPDDSFIIWHPELIRWGNLPPNLEDALQSWLTPSGWRVGPPRMMTWGSEGAFFAMSEYGDVVYRLGDAETWDIYKETVEEWKSEKGFLWSSLAFIALDSTSTDQFIAIRNDGTWAGSIDDINEDALEEFALNFFARAKSKHKSKPSTSQSSGTVPPDTPNPQPANTKPDAATQALYERWSLETATMFATASAALGGSKTKTPRKLQVRSPSSNASAGPSTSPAPRPLPVRTSSANAKLLTSFPYLPNALTVCSLPSCVVLKADENSIHACQHDVERLLRASGLYSYEWLRQERLRWHPDRFGRLCEESWRETGKRMAGEMFKLIHLLMEKLKTAEGSKDNNGDV